MDLDDLTTKLEEWQANLNRAGDASLAAGFKILIPGLILALLFWIL